MRNEDSVLGLLVSLTTEFKTRLKWKLKDNVISV